MVPTDRAVALRSRLAEALSQLRAAVMLPDAFDPAVSERTFVVVANDSVFTILALDVMAEVLSHGNPHLRMAVVPAYDDRIVERMARGEVDLVLGDVDKVPETLKARFLLVDDFVLAQRHAHPRGMAAPELDEYCALHHVVVSARADFYTPVDAVLEKLGKVRKVVAAVPGYNQVALVLSQSDGVATLPRQLMQRYSAFVDLIDLPFTIPSFRLAMAWHPRAQNDPASMWIRQCFMNMGGNRARHASADDDGVTTEPAPM